MKTLHKLDCTRAFKNYDLTCARCIELANGSKARAGWSDHKRQFERDSIAATDAHFKSHAHLSGQCGPVCTFGDW